ncbi:MAG: DUF4446 family protein [Candidatus Limnocylindria bacterium]
MPLDQQALSVAVVLLGAAVVALGVWVAALDRSARALRRRLRAVFAEAGEKGLDEILDGLLRDMDSTGARVDALASLQRDLEAVLRRAVQRVGVVRFNPFPDAGGDQSFAIALLDAEGTGLVISSLHSRSDTRVFAKAIANGRSRHALSAEEQDAIDRAFAHSDRKS